MVGGGSVRGGVAGGRGVCAKWCGERDVGCGMGGEEGCRGGVRGGGALDGVVGGKGGQREV